MSSLSAFSRPMISFLEELATGASTAAVLTDCIMDLVQNSVVPNIDNSLGAYSICTFDGYASKTLATWTPPYTDLAKDQVISPSVTPAFSCTGNVTVNTVYGYILKDATNTTLLAMAQFDMAITPVGGQSFSVKPELSMSGEVESCVC